MAPADIRGSRSGFSVGKTSFIVHEQSLTEQLSGALGSALQTGVRDEDMSWATREQQALGRIPSRGDSVNKSFTVGLS